MTTTQYTVGVVHLTYTGEYAGSYLCGKYTAAIGRGSSGYRLPQDSSFHYAYAPEFMLTSPFTCPDCREVAASVA